MCQEKEKSMILRVLANIFWSSFGIMFFVEMQKFQNMYNFLFQKITLLITEVRLRQIDWK